MTTTPMTPERLREIAELCEASTPGRWTTTINTTKREYCVISGPEWPIATIAYDDDRRPVTDELDPGRCVHGDARFIAASRTAIPELIAEVARLRSDLDHATAHDGDHLSKASRAMVDTVIGERDALRLEVTRLRTEIGEAKLVLEQQDRDLSQQRASIAALQAGHAEMRRGCEEWRAECDERDSRIAALEARCRILEDEPAPQWLERQHVVNQERIAALEAGLRQACDWASCESGEGILDQRSAIVRLRALADGVDFKETT